MTSIFSKQIFVPAAVIIFGLMGVYLLSGFIEKNRPAMPAGYEDEALVFQGAKLKQFSLGLNGLIADWYWMKSLQYLGGKFAQKPDVRINVNDLSEFDPKLLYPLLDNAVGFDPQFIGVYEYGAVVLPAIDPRLAIKIVEKGIENNPKEWRLYNQLGYIYWRNNDFEMATQAYAKAAEIEGASPLMKAMIAKMRTDGGSRETARSIYSQMHENASDDSTKQTALLYLMKLDALDEIDAINEVLNSDLRRENNCPGDFRNILPQLSRVKLPNNKEFQFDRENKIVDPGGTPYVLNRAKCSAELNPELTKLPLN